MEKYLIVLDLDGTLLYDWKTLKEDTKDYLLELSKEGHKLVIATGRPFRSSERYYKMLELDTPIINYNGGLVTSKNDDNFQCFSLTVEKEYIIDIFEKTKNYIKNAFGEIGDDIYLLHDTEEIRPLIHNFNGARLTMKNTIKVKYYTVTGVVNIVSLLSCLLLKQIRGTESNMFQNI